MSRQDIIRAYARHYNPTLAAFFDAGDIGVELRGRGMKVEDEEGHAYLDFGSGMGVLSVGHANSRVQEAILAQLETLATAPPLAYHRPAAELMSRLAALLPRELSRISLCGSGSEAVEIILRTAMLARPGRTRLVAANNGYHGKTLGALGVLGQPGMRDLFGTLWGDVRFVTYGDAGELAKAVDETTLAVFLEPVMGGGFITVPPPGYLAEAQALCNKTGALLVLDEVQTGFGRTGKMFAFEHDQVVPDGVVLSKGITGGHVSLAAAVVNDRLVQDISRRWEPESLRFGRDLNGSPVVCAAACAALDFIVSERLPERAATVGAYLQQKLQGVAEEFPKLALGAPGRGLMVGVKLRNNMIEEAVLLQMMKRGVLPGFSTNATANHPVLRFFPPLIVDRADVDTAVEALRESLHRLNRTPPVVFDMMNRGMRVQFRMPVPLLRAVARLFA